MRFVRARLPPVIHHRQTEKRSLAMAQEIVRRIDADPEHRALGLARERCRAWLEKAPCSDLHRWAAILEQPWNAVRRVLLDTSETGIRLRQSNPFCGVLTPRERWDIHRRMGNHETPTP